MFFAGLLMAIVIGIPAAFLLSYVFHLLMVLFGESLFGYIFIGFVCALMAYFLGVSKERDRVQKSLLEEQHSQH